MPQITELPVATSVTPDDLLLLVNDPGGSPSAQRARVSDIVALATTILAGASWQGSYAGGTTYAAGDVVSNGGSVYISLVSSNTGHTPASSPTQWQVLVAQGPAGDDGAASIVPGPAGAAGLPSQWDSADWNDTATYAKGTGVHHAGDGASYVAVVDSATTDPSTDHGSGGAWRKISDRGEQGAKSFGIPTEWAASTAYSAGSSSTPADTVFHTDSSYVCLISHTSTGSFATDLGAGKWQMIAAPGGLSAITGGGPVTIDNTNPTIPEVDLTTDAANGVPLLGADGFQRPIQRPTWVRNFRYANVATGSGNEAWGRLGTLDSGDTTGVQGATTADNQSYADAVEVARVVVPGDATSTGDYAYQRMVDLEASVTAALGTDNGQVYYAWVRNSDNYRIHPTVISPKSATVGLTSTHFCHAYIRAYAPAQDAVNNETYILKAWTLDAAVLWNFNSGQVGAYDTVKAITIPV